MLRRYDPPLKPLTIVNAADGKLSACDYFGSRWDKELVPYLSCHQGVLRLFNPWGRHSMRDLRDCPFVILTRGNWQVWGGKHDREPLSSREMLEFYFPSSQEGEGRLIYLDLFQANRFPGWQPGKRCWQLEIYSGGLWELDRIHKMPVFWRSAPLPCVKPWEGPRQDGKPD